MIPCLPCAKKPGGVWMSSVCLPKTESYRHIRLKKLYEQQFCLPEPSFVEFTPLSESYLVFVNGQFQESLSKWEGIEVSPRTRR